MQWAFDTTLRLGLQPLLVRPAARLLPGDQAPLRRHEDVARGELRHHRAQPPGRSRTTATTAPELVSAGKCYVGRYGAELIQDCVQLHGGIGVTFDHDLHLFLRRVTTNVPTLRQPRPSTRCGSPRILEVAGERPMTDDADDADRYRGRAELPASGPARGWPTNMPPGGDPARGRSGGPRSDEEELARIARCRELQRMLFDGGFAGICVPAKYGGQGLTTAHQAAFNGEIAGYDYPSETQIPTFTPCMAVILEFGTEEQKQRHIPPILKGEAFWMQFLSEPSGGSDVGRGADHRHARRRRVGHERLEDLDDRRLVGGLGPVPGPDQLGRPEAPRPDRVHAADPPARDRDPPHRDAQRLPGVLPGVHHRRPDPRHATGSARSTRAGRSGSGGCTTSAP